MNRADQWAAVTGASSGIGAELARLLSLEGYSVLLAARREDRLREVQKTLASPSEIVVCDLSDPSGVRLLKERMGQVHLSVFVNNAGFGACGDFSEMDSVGTRMIQVNIEAVHELTLEALRVMELQGGGTILNVASSAGLLPCGPYMTDYYATKSYVRSLSEGLAEELRRKGSPVRVFCLCPGPVDTEFNEVAQVRFAIPGLSAQQCAAAAMRGMKRRKVLIIPSFPVRAGLFMQRFLPRSLLVRLIANAQKHKIS